MSVVNTYNNGHFEIGINPDDPTGLADGLTKALGAIITPPLTTIITPEGRKIVGDVSPDIDDPETLLQVLVADAEIAATYERPGLTVNCLGHIAFIDDSSDSFRSEYFDF